MARVMSSMSMSPDGFVAARDASREHPLGVGGQRLHDWIRGDDPRDAAVLDEMVRGAGAIVMGRYSYDQCEGDGGWGDDGPLPGVPCFVLTHHPPDRVGAPHVYTFVTDGIEHAIAQAKAVAGDRTVGLHGATALQQALRGEAITLERDRVIESPGGTHLRFRVADLGGRR